MTKIYEVKNGIAQEIMKDIFELQNRSYNLRSSCNQFRRKHKNCSLWLTVVRNLGPNIWELVPSNITSKSKKLIKSWKPVAGPCRLYKTHNTQVGFI